MAGVPNISLNDGNSIPQLGFGVWQVPNNEVQAAVSEALQAGYRSIDTAQGYNNEEGVGRAIKDSGIAREELFVTSKLRTRDQAYDQAIKSFHGSLEKLGLDYLDLFLIHWPVPGQDKYPEAWKAFVQLQKEGLSKSIGVSNFLPEHLERIIGETGVTPAVNQIEVHPEYQQRDVLDFHVKNRIAIESYSPLGSGAALKNPTIAEIAEKHGKSPAQAILRWHIQEGFIVIPKSTHPERIRANIDVFDFELDGEDLQRIAGLDRPDGKTGGDPATNNAIW
ncbi:MULTISPECIES: aldo/keto reductase [unclassified Devosia]|uniref:aldo/keto reductase n=1 Tax=unclassified Devosia TaxID=196773 RepID=UPI0015524DA3|nr:MULTISPECIES: aldo/keto reductase [unclassified Devosia]